MNAPVRILILCTGNSCRSQMAEGILRDIDPRLEVHSAGTQPASRVHPGAVSAMREIGLDISAARPKNVNAFVHQPFDFVITVCDSARESCPVFSGRVTRRLHIGFDDPADARGTEGEVAAVFRRVRDEIGRDFRTFYDAEVRPLVRD